MFEIKRYQSVFQKQPTIQIQPITNTLVPIFVRTKDFAWYYYLEEQYVLAHIIVNVSHTAVTITHF